jgi:hypothetical protein
MAAGYRVRCSGELGHWARGVMRWVRDPGAGRWAGGTRCETLGAGRRRWARGSRALGPWTRDLMCLAGGAGYEAGCDVLGRWGHWTGGPGERRWTLVLGRLGAECETWGAGYDALGAIFFYGTVRHWGEALRDGCCGPAARFRSAGPVVSTHWVRRTGSEVLGPRYSVRDAGRWGWVGAGAGPDVLERGGAGPEALDTGVLGARRDALGGRRWAGSAGCEACAMGAR